MRARTAQTMAGAPALLILDNCEHVVGAVADLVAFLVASCPRLRVVTTTRAPLAIAAERVFPLSQLDDDAACDCSPNGPGQRVPGWPSTPPRC